MTKKDKPEMPVGQALIWVIQGAQDAFKWLKELEEEWKRSSGDGPSVRRKQRIVADAFVMYIYSLFDTRSGTHSFLNSYEPHPFIEAFSKHLLVKKINLHRNNRSGHQSKQYGFVIQLEEIITSDIDTWLNGAYALVGTRSLPLKGTTTMIIRDAEKKDLGDIKEVYSLYYKDKKDLNHIATQVEEIINKSELAQQRDSHCLVAEINAKISGIVVFRKPAEDLLQFTKTSKPVELYSLFIRDKGQGIGRPLVEEMIKQAREFGYTEVIVYSAQRWSESWGFYDQLGFIRVGQMNMGWHGQAWTMILN